MKRIFLFPLFFFSFSLLSVAYAGDRLILASTTSTENSGFFDYILPIFEENTGISVHVIAVGTGAAIELGKRGDADAVLVHAKEQELKAVEEGFFTGRKDVMYNDFVVLGPEGDPAGISKARSVVEAFRKIKLSGQAFVSRGDNSGTHAKELEIWRKAGTGPPGKGYMDAGQGMARTLRLVDEKRAYTLSDRATYLSMKGKLQLKVLFEGDPALFNQYGIMAVNPARHKHVNYKAAKELSDWLTSEDGQKAIASFTDKKGNRLFVPNAR